MKLYGVARSRATRAIWLLGEIGMEYQHIPVIQAYRLNEPMAPDAPLNTLSPAFLALSPAGAIPVLQDGSLTLSESVAISLYLAKAYGGDLGPRDPQEEALMLQWGLYGITAIEGHALAILYARSEGRGDSPEVAAARTALARPLKVLDAHLAAGGHMVGGRFTVADINMAEMVRYASGEADLMAGFPAVTAWLERLHERPAFKSMWAMRVAEPK
jgi:glutathione S-transferase